MLKVLEKVNGRVRKLFHVFLEELKNMIRLLDLMDLLGVSRATIYRWLGDAIPEPKYFPGTRIPFWDDEEIKAKVVFFSDQTLSNLREVRAKRKAAKKQVKISV